MKRPNTTIRGAREQDLEGIRELITARDVELYPDAFRSCIMRSFMTQSVVFLSALMTSVLLLGFHMATFLCFLAAFEVAIWGGNRLWWIKKHEGLMHELNNWSGFNRIYTANESCIFLVATVEDEVDKTVEKVVGCTAIRRADHPVYTNVLTEQRLSPSTLAISRVGVSPSYRRLGIAKRLLRACETHIEKMSSHTSSAHEPKPDLILGVFDFQIPAIQLYERFGFNPVRKVVSPMLFHSGKLTNCFYIKRFEDVSSKVH